MPTMFRMLLVSGFSVAVSAAPQTVIRSFQTGDKQSLGLVHDAELAWTTTVVQEGSDAERAGVQVGWRLLTVNGEDASTKSNYALISKLSERPLELEYALPYKPHEPCDDSTHQALYEAVRTGRTRDVYAHLETFKCDLNTKPKDEPLPVMHLAADGGSMGKIRALHAYGARVDEDFEGDRPVHLAVRKQHAFATHWLLTLGANPDNTDASGLPLTHATAKACAMEPMKVIKMKKKLDLFSLHEGSTPEDLARANCSEDNGMAAMLARWAADKKKEDKENFASLMKGAEL